MKKMTGLTVAVFVMAWAVVGWAQTNLTVVRHADNTLWKMTCEGTSSCSAWTQIPGGFKVQPTLTWDPAIQKYILIGIGNNGSNIWRSTFEADGTWNNNWALIGTGATGSPSPVAVTGGGFNTLNSQQIALLRWYEANQSGNSFTVGTNPCGVAFDGANIWVVNGNYSIMKMRPSDGFLLETYGVGSSSISGVAFDGANIWVADGLNGVTKLRASDGFLLGNYTVGTWPALIVVDGANIWVTNSGSNNVTKLRASDGSALGTYSVGTAPYGVAFDGINVWVANYGSANVTKLRASDGLVLGTYNVGTHPWGVAFDGANVWVTNQGSNTVSKL